MMPTYEVMIAKDIEAATISEAIDKFWALVKTGQLNKLDCAAEDVSDQE